MDEKTTAALNDSGNGLSCSEEMSEVDIKSFVYRATRARPPNFYLVAPWKDSGPPEYMIDESYFDTPAAVVTSDSDPVVVHHNDADIDEEIVGWCATQ